MGFKALARFCFVDNDVILKLTSCDLFWEAIAALDCDADAVRVLKSAKHVFNSSKTRRKYSDLVCDQAISVVTQCQPIHRQARNPYLNLSLENVDIGELILTFEAIGHENYLLATGDKRYLQALAQNKELEDMYRSLMGRVICFEQIIIRLVETQGFEVVRWKATSARDCDAALKAAFGSGLLADQSNVLDSLNSYINEIQESCPGLLAA